MTPPVLCGSGIEAAGILSGCSEIPTVDVEGEEAMATAHVGGRHANMDYWDPRFCGLIEVYSCHGAFDWLVMEALQRGYVFGVVAGSDFAGRITPLSCRSAVHPETANNNAKT